MSKPSKFVSLSKNDLLHKYTSEGWPEKLQACNPDCRERRYTPCGPLSTVKKRTCLYLDADGDVVASVLVFTRADTSEETMVMYIVDGDTAFHANT